MHPIQELIKKKLVFGAWCVFEEELLEEAWDEAQEDDVLSLLPAGLLDMFRCMKIDPDVVRDAIVGGGVQI